MLKLRQYPFVKHLKQLYYNLIYPYVYHMHFWHGVALIIRTFKQSKLKYSLKT